MVAVSVRVLPEARSVVAPLSASLAAAPATTLNVIGLPVPAAKPDAEAVIVTVPARLPVTVWEARPATALLDPNPVTLPAPEVWAKVTLRVSEVMVLPKASSIVAVRARVPPDARFAVEPLNASLFAAAAL